MEPVQGYGHGYMQQPGVQVQQPQQQPQQGYGQQYGYHPGGYQFGMAAAAPPPVQGFFNPWDPPPPPSPAPLDVDLHKRIDKLVEYAAKNGPQFEALMKEKQKDSPAYAFLFGAEGHAYYRYKLWITINPHLAGLSQAIPQALNPGLLVLNAPVNAPLAAVPGLNPALNPGVAVGPRPFGGPVYYEQQQQQQHLHHHHGQFQPDRYGGYGAPPFAAQAASLPPDVAAELKGVLDNLTGSKESIKVARTWFMSRAAYAAPLAESMKDRLLTTEDVERQLHVLFVVNEVLLNRMGQRSNPKELDNEALAFRPVLGAMLGAVYHSKHNVESNQSRLQKMLQVWGQAEVYDIDTVNQLEGEMVAGPPPLPRLHPVPSMVPPPPPPEASAPVPQATIPGQVPYTYPSQWQQEPQRSTQPPDHQQEQQPQAPPQQQAPQQAQPQPLQPQPLVQTLPQSQTQPLSQPQPSAAPVQVQGPSTPPSSASQAPGFSNSVPAAPQFFSASGFNPAGPQFVAAGSVPTLYTGMTPPFLNQVPIPVVPPVTTPAIAQLPSIRPPLDASTPYPLFPPGLIPGMVRKMQIGSGVPYSPLSPLDIPTAIPASTASESYILDRVSKFFNDIGEIDPLDGQQRTSADGASNDDSDDEERSRDGGARIPPIRMQVDMETGTLPDGSLEHRPGVGGAGRLGLGAEADPNKVTQYDDVYTSYRKQRSTNYHTSLSARAVSR